MQTEFPRMGKVCLRAQNHAVLWLGKAINTPTPVSFCEPKVEVTSRLLLVDAMVESQTQLGKQDRGMVFFPLFVKKAPPSHLSDLLLTLKEGGASVTFNHLVFKT